MAQKRDAAGRPARRKAASGRGPVELIIAKHRGQKRALIPILQDLEARDGWLAPEILDEVARRLNISPAHVFSVATFYRAFSLEPRGRHRCTVCMGTACHVRGGAIILEHLERKLGIRVGRTSPDGEFTLERVNCLGACALAPLVVVDGRYYARMTEIKADAALKAIDRGKKGTEAGP